MTFNTLIANKYVYKLESYSYNIIEDKIKLNYFEQILKSAYAEPDNHIACKKCIDEFDNICFFWNFSCDIWYSHYDFEFSEIKKLMHTPEFLLIFKACLKNY